jgi:HD-like signal output (HDOD) protein
VLQGCHHFYSDNRKNLWFNCKCGSALMVPAGMFSHYNPLSGLSPLARETVRTTPQLSQFPHCPKEVMDFQSVLKDGKVSPAQVAALAASFAPLPCKVLIIVRRMRANLFSPQPVAGMEEVVTLLGRERTAELVPLSALMCLQVSYEKFDTDRFWKSSLLCGAIAETLAGDHQNLTLVTPFKAFMAGALANIGKLVMAVCLPQVVETIFEEAAMVKYDTSWSKIEELLRIKPHTVLGEIGASCWGFSDDVVEAAARHHERLGEAYARHNITISEIVALANQIKHWLNLEPNKINHKFMYALATHFGFVTSKALDEYVERRMIPLIQKFK